MAKQHIKEGKVKYSNEDYSKPVKKAPTQPDVIDQLFSNPVDLVRNMFSRK
jgi:hypothetical protein